MDLNKFYFTLLSPFIPEFGIRFGKAMFHPCKENPKSLDGSTFIQASFHNNSMYISA